MEIKIVIQEGAALVHIAAASQWLNHYLKNCGCDPYLTAEAAGNEFTLTVPPAGSFTNGPSGSTPVAFIVSDEAASSFYNEVYWVNGRNLYGSEAPTEPVLQLDYAFFGY